MKDPLFDFEQIIANTPGHVYWLDKSNIYYGCNELQAIAFGLSSWKEVIGKKNADFLDQTAANIYDKNNLDVMVSGISKAFVETLVLKDGTVSTFFSYKKPLFDLKQNVIGLIGISIDVTEAEQVRRELVKEKDAAHLALDNIIANLPGHVYWHDRNNVFLGCNDLQAKSAGLNSRMEIVGKTNRDMPWKDQADTFDRVNNEVMETGKEYCVEESGILSDGRKITCLSKKVPMRDKNGEIVGIMGISFDITERKEMEEALRIAKEEAEAANNARMQFLARMQHDICGPVSGIVNAALLIKAEKNNKTVQQKTDSIITTAQALLEFVTDLLRDAMLEKGITGTVPIRSFPFNFLSVLQTVINLHTASLGNKKLDFRAYVDKSIPARLVGDPIRLKNVISELVNNAIKYTERGSIKVYAAHVKNIFQESIIRVEVEDTGPGMPLEQQRQIFDREFRPEREPEKIYQGFGLGLKNTIDTVLEVGGEIYLESALNKGSRFICFFPFTDRTVDPTQDAPKLVETLADLSERDRKPSYILLEQSTIPSVSQKPIERRGPKIHILIVEDHRCAALALAEIVESLGCITHIASTAAEAILLFEIQRYDLVFMDLNLPDSTGYDTARRMRISQATKNPQTAILALTSVADRETKRRCLDVHMNAIFQKPLSSGRLQDILGWFIPDYIPDYITSEYSHLSS